MAKVTGLGGVFYVAKDPEATRQWYRVPSRTRSSEIDGMVAQLKAKGVAILDSADEGYGKFAWLLDPDGIKIELWEQCAAPEA